MNELDATRAKLKCLEMVEGTPLKWWAVIRHKPLKEKLNNEPLCYKTEHVELALGIVEGKPVWAGDELYWIGNSPSKELADSGHNFKLSTWSWNPPKPKTVMVELLVEDAKQIAMLYGVENRASTACRKALEEMK